MNYDLSRCEQPNEPRDLMEEAGRMVGIDLKNPIDVSQMQVHSVESMPNQKDYGQIFIIRKAKLFAYVTNEFGEPEELTIKFTLKSTRQPKRKEILRET